VARGRKAGNRGQGSKWITRKRRHAIYARDNHTCLWCGSTESLTLDHFTPRCRRGSNKTENLFTACMRCNRNRGNSPVLKFAVGIARDTGHVAVAVVNRIVSQLNQPLPEDA
jgi:5-methylcytosine-specific restriction endonuclease McrA